MSGNTGGGGASPIRVMLEATEQINRACQAWEPAGMLEVLAVYDQWPTVLEELTKAWAAMHTKAQAEFPLKPVVVALVEGVHRAQRTTAAAAEQIAPTARAVHRDKLDALEDPRNAMWDLRANNPGVARGA